MIFYGIDPGLEGAIAIMDSESGTVRIIDTPTITITDSKKMKKGKKIRSLSSLVASPPSRATQTTILADRSVERFRTYYTKATLSCRSSPLSTRPSTPVQPRPSPCVALGS